LGDSTATRLGTPGAGAGPRGALRRELRGLRPGTQPGGGVQQRRGLAGPLTDQRRMC